MDIEASQARHQPSRIERKATQLDTSHKELDGLGHEIFSESSPHDFLEKQDYFGLPADTEEQKQVVVEKLEQLAKGSGKPFDTLPLPFLKAQLSKLILEDSVEVAEASFSSLFDLLRTKQISNRDYLQKVMVLAKSDKEAVPPEYLVQYEHFQALLSPKLIENEQDRKWVVASFSALDLSTNPDPIAFIHTEILANESISEQTKARVSEAFDLPPLDVNSGTDIAKGLIEQIVNPETGEMEYRFNEDRKLEFRPGLKAFNENATGNKIITAELADGRKRSFDVTGWPASTLTEFSDQLMMWKILEEAGISNFMEEVFYIDQSLVDHFDPAEARQSRQTVEALMGWNAGYDGRIMTEEDGKFLTWMVQALHKRGDAAQGDYDIHTANQGLVELGIKDKEGEINFNVLKASSSYLRGIYLSGEPSFVGLKDHLNRL